MGFHEEKVPGINEDQEVAISSTLIWVQNASDEVGRVNFWFLLKNNGSHQQNLDSWWEDGGHDC